MLTYLGGYVLYRLECERVGRADSSALYWTRLALEFGVILISLLYTVLRLVFIHPIFVAV